MCNYSHPFLRGFLRVPLTGGYPNAQKIVRVWEQTPDGHRMNPTGANFDDFRTQNDTFTSLAGYEDGLFSVSSGSKSMRVNIVSVSSGFFKALGVESLHGRVFAPKNLSKR